MHKSSIENQGNLAKPNVGGSMVKILNAVSLSFRMLELEDDWDDDGAVKPNPILLNKALLFVHLLASEVENLVAPSINPCRDGSVDVEFEKSNKYQLLVNIQIENSSVYGDNGNNEDVIRSSEVKTKEIIKWCQKNMTEL